MPQPFEQSPLWRRTLAECSGDRDRVPRQSLRSGYLQFRSAVVPLAEEISQSLPMFTDHSIAHADALWDIASLICGENFPLNPAEAFVLGGAFLLHDVGMGLASYQHGTEAIEGDPRFPDLLASATVRLRRADPSAGPQDIASAARDESIAELLRLRHAPQAENLVTTIFETAGREPFYLIVDPVLRQAFGSLIGRIAHSHWWPVSDLRELGTTQGSWPEHPPDWEVDPLKIACVLRLADAAHIDHRRAPTYLHAFRRPALASRDHWYFQERLTRPRVNADRLEYTATRAFDRNEVSAWWLAWETIRGIDDQLRQVDELCVDLGRPRFAVRSVAGVDSPDRMARYIHTQGWQPINASLRVSGTTELVANLAGQNMYGHRPEIAIRELVANAADATQAWAMREKAPVGPVTVRLVERGDSWWLTVEDHGIGMQPETMVAALTDFGYTGWRSAEMITDFPGLLSGGFQPTGRFGIGFFAVFLVSDHVDVISLGHGEARRSTHVLEFSNGVMGRPLLRRAEKAEQLPSSGTVVRAKLRSDPRSMAGLFKTTQRGLSHTQLLHSRLIRMCALAEVHIDVQGPDDPSPVRVVEAKSWVSIPGGELFRRLYPRGEASHLDRLSFDGFEKLFAEHATELHGPDGRIVGRAMLVSGSELLPQGLRWVGGRPAGLIYVGGYQADEIDHCVGAFAGRPLTPDRLRAWPTVTTDEFRSWVETQADRVRDNPEPTPANRYEIGCLARGLGAVAGRLPCAQSRNGPLDRDGLANWVARRREVVLISTGTLQWHDRGGGRVTLYALDGRQLSPPDDALFVDFNPLWLFPEEVLKRPRDEHFAHVLRSPATWNLETWWYDTGNFGGIGLVVRTIAETWRIGVEEAVRLMEPLDIQEDRDLRLRIATDEGEPIRVTAIRMRRPLASP